MDSDWAIAARRTERFTDHATMPRQASTARPIRPRAAPTAMKTVPSGVFVVCMYGAFAVGGTVTMGAPVVVVDEDVDVVVVETDDVVLVLSVVEVEVSVEEVDEVVVVSMVVVVFSDFVEVDEEDVVVSVFSEDEVEVVSLVVAVVSVTLGVLVLVLSLVERSSVVWATSAFVSVVLSPAFWADTRAAMTITSRKRRISRGWEFPSPRGRSRMVTRQ